MSELFRRLVQVSNPARRQADEQFNDRRVRASCGRSQALAQNFAKERGN
jgi:hypothetical protein